MSQHDPDEINRLIGKFTDLQEQWESDPEAFDWSALHWTIMCQGVTYRRCRITLVASNYLACFPNFQ